MPIPPICRRCAWPAVTTATLTQRTAAVTNALRTIITVSFAAQAYTGLRAAARNVPEVLPTGRFLRRRRKFCNGVFQGVTTSLPHHHAGGSGGRALGSSPGSDPGDVPVVGGRRVDGGDRAGRRRSP